MNERVKELITQAGTDISGKWLSLDNVNTLIELVVQECAKLANEETSLPYDSYSEKIKQHFGVEE